MWDVFISHASEDKELLVRPLAKQLSEVYRAKVWYDEFSIEYGDSLLESIEKGLQDSKYGVVVFSQSFFKKVWPDHEYKSLRTKEMMLNRKVIIPVWYNVTREEISEYSLILADKSAIRLNSKLDIDDLAIKILKIIRPDIYDNISRMQIYEKLLKKSRQYTIRNEDFQKIIAIPPVRHDKLSTQMKARLKLIHNAIKDVDLRSYEVYEEDFRRSTNIDREIIITELLAAAYLDCINIREMSEEEKTILYIHTLSLCNNDKPDMFSSKEWEMFNKIIKSYVNDINASIVVEYKFE